jgi:hypothetical protein
MPNIRVIIEIKSAKINNPNMTQLAEQLSPAETSSYPAWVFDIKSIEKANPDDNSISNIRRKIRDFSGNFASDRLQEIELAVSELAGNCSEESDDGRVVLILLEQKLQILTINSFDPDKPRRPESNLLHTKEQIDRFLDEAEVAMDSLGLLIERLDERGRGRTLITLSCREGDTYDEWQEGDLYKTQICYMYDRAA